MLALFLLEGERSLAWSVTVACYSGLHLVEAALAHDGEHCDDHRQRNKRLKSERSLQNLWRHYRPLYDASLRGTDRVGAFRRLVPCGRLLPL